ncbi:hypothetical protein AB4Y97_18480 [Microvirga sp. 2TAF3]
MPAAPLLGYAVLLLLQFSNGAQRLMPCGLKVRNLDACFIQDCFVAIHKMKEAAHLKPA